jgi:glycosyltransferase involved in cell wall biosynthesis
VNVLIVSGIWPPDVGGPASHAPEFAERLRARGHEVEVVITADAAPAPEAYRVRWTSRRTPRGVRHVLSAASIAHAARRADVVYTTGMLVRSALGSSLARTPLVMKLTSDPTYERALRYGFSGGGLEAFQDARGARVRALRRARDLAVGRAAHLVVPSDALRQLALGWGIPEQRITLVPNPVEAPVELASREELRRKHALDGPTLVFAGRLAPQKALGVALDALARVPSVTLLIAGDGPEESQLREHAAELGLDGRVHFLGAQPRSVVFELLRAADGALLTSSWENFPHVVVEALAVGTPVLATAVGGVSEIVRDGENGLLVPVGDAAALARAIERYFEDAGLRQSLRAAADSSVEVYAPDRIYEQLEQILERASHA